VPAALKNDPGLLYDRVRLLRIKDENAAAAALLDPPPPTSAYPDKMWRELEWQARRALDRGDAALAYRLAGAHAAEGGSTFADGEWLAGWIALRYLADAPRGYEHFVRLYDGVSSTISRGRGAYWAGRAAEAMGNRQLATEWFRKASAHLGSYYGQLGAERLGASDMLHLPALPAVEEAARAAFGKQELVRLMRMMGELEQTDRVRSFMVRLAEAAKTPVEFRLLAELGKDIGRPDFGVAVAKVARQQGIELVDVLYPTTKLPAGDAPEDALVLAVIRQESAFDRRAESSAGALGLMQLLPRTAKYVAKHLGIAFSEKKLTSDAQYNIRIGRAYLADLIDSYGGSYLLAAAAYNAGPSRVKEWIATYGDPRDAGVDTVDWVESIPFSETRNYVQRVLENLQIYRHRLEGGTEIALSLERDLNRPSQP
jgi:soluble lytic murein transglycosylase